MLSSQPIACTDCQGQLRIAQAARTTLLPPPISPASTSRSNDNRRTERPRGLRRKPYDLAPGIHIFAHSTLTDVVATNITAELARLHKESRVDISVPRTVRHRASDAPVPQFSRFLELPAEIRNCIYEQVVSKDSILRLRCFVLPGVCRASRQLREESLPLFFAQNHFIAEVKTNFEGISACATHGTHAKYITKDDMWRYRLAGKLDLNAIVEKMLALCHRRLIRIRTIDFCMTPLHRRERRDEMYRYAILSVRHDRIEKVSTHIKEGNDREYTRHLQRILQEGRDLLNDIVCDSDYGGLFMLQLRDVASTFVAGTEERQTRLRQRQAALLIEHPWADPDLDEFGLQDAETYFEENGNAARSRTLAELPSNDRDEFDLPGAEAYFGGS